MANDHVPGRPYPEQHRKDTADFVPAGGKTIKQCAKGLGPNDKTPSDWVAGRRRELGTGGTARLKPAEPKPDPELAAARKRVREPGLENDFLRRAAACFARATAQATRTPPCGRSAPASRCP